MAPYTTHTLADRTLIDTHITTIKNAWLLSPEDALSDASPSDDARDWGLDLLAPLARLAELTSDNVAKAVGPLIDCAVFRYMESGCFDDEAKEVTVEDVLTAIERVECEGGKEVSREVRSAVSPTTGHDGDAEFVEEQEMEEECGEETALFLGFDEVNALEEGYFEDEESSDPEDENLRLGREARRLAEVQKKSDAYYQAPPQPHMKVQAPVTPRSDPAPPPTPSPPRILKRPGAAACMPKHLPAPTNPPHSKKRSAPEDTTNEPSLKKPRVEETPAPVSPPRRIRIPRSQSLPPRISPSKKSAPRSIVLRRLIRNMKLSISHAEAMQKNAELHKLGTEYEWMAKSLSLKQELAELQDEEEDAVLFGRDL